MSTQPQLPTIHVRNLAEARDHVRQLAIRQVLSSLIRQYGLDDLLIGLRFTYREQVFAKAKSTPAVRHRADLLNDTVRRLSEAPHEPDMLRVSKADAA